MVTSDQEEAIRGGLNTSVLRDAAFQIMCGLHAKWNVSAHKYVHVYVSLMYHSCINHAYHSCITHVSPIRITHVSPICITHVSPICITHVSPVCITHVSPICITHVSPICITHVSPVCITHVSPNLEDLYDDVKKTFFKGNLPFCNGVLVDMCETLFSAVKTWVSGRCKNKRVTLLMAFVRICHGVYQMAVAGFLSPVADAMKKTSSPNPQVSSMFRVFCKKLTTRAVTDMFRSLQRKWGSYDVTSRMDLSIQLVSNAGDVFVVDNHFKCKCKVNDG